MFSRATGVAFRFGIPLIALGMLSFATISVVRARTPRPEYDPPYAPAENKFARSVAATGIIEPSSENILIGSQKSGVVRKVFVKVGDRVSKGQTILLVEAMKTFNQIHAPNDGVVKQILVGNADPVEFNQPLMIIE